jgi:hypothetical protein
LIAVAAQIFVAHLVGVVHLLVVLVEITVPSVDTVDVAAMTACTPPLHVVDHHDVLKSKCLDFLSPSTRTIY